MIQAGGTIGMPLGLRSKKWWALAALVAVLVAAWAASAFVTQRAGGDAGRAAARSSAGGRGLTAPLPRAALSSDSDVLTASADASKTPSGDDREDGQDGGGDQGTGNGPGVPEVKGKIPAQAVSILAGYSLGAPETYQARAELLGTRGPIACLKVRSARLLAGVDPVTRQPIVSADEGRPGADERLAGLVLLATIASSAKPLPAPGSVVDVRLVLIPSGASATFVLDSVGSAER